MNRIIRGELQKVRTTNVWWLIALGALLATALAFTLNAVGAHYELAKPADPAVPPGGDADAAAAQHQRDLDRWTGAHSAAGLARIAANVYTSGQYFGLMFVMVLGALMITNEFYHHTAAPTFLATPRRSRVVVGKLCAATVMATGFWLVTTVLDLVAGAVFFHSEGVAASLGRWDVTRSLLLNLAAYALWGVFGVGLGVLLRNQIGAVVTGTVGYVLSLPAALVVLEVVRSYVIRDDWVYNLQVLIPGIASFIMVTPGRPDPHTPPQWVGALVLVGYGVLASAIGALLVRRRDIA